MKAIVRNIIKEQNRELLRSISDKYGLKQEDLERKYWTPSFYSIDVDSIVYNIQEVKKN